jgi:hypothetical protein
LDRYHRFQLTFDLFARHRLMLLKQRDIDVRAIGTGPGPSSELSPGGTIQASN